MPYLRRCPVLTAMNEASRQLPAAAGEEPPPRLPGPRAAACLRRAPAPRCLLLRAARPGPAARDSQAFLRPRF